MDALSRHDFLGGGEMAVQENKPPGGLWLRMKNQNPRSQLGLAEVRRPASETLLAHSDTHRQDVRRSHYTRVSHSGVRGILFTLPNAWTPLGWPWDGKRAEGQRAATYLDVLGAVWRSRKRGQERQPCLKFVCLFVLKFMSRSQSAGLRGNRQPCVLGVAEGAG